MQTEILSLERANADKAYSTGTDAEKLLLEKLYPTVYSRDITERINTLDDVYALCGVDRASIMNATDTPDEIAYKDAKHIVLAYNEGWVKGDGEYGYYPLMKKNSAGSGFSYYDCDYAGTISSVGSRLQYRSAKLMLAATSKFPQVYSDLWS